MPDYRVTVTPFDWSASGSYQLRKRWYKALSKLHSSDSAEQAGALVTLEEMLESQIVIEGDTPLSQILDEISAADFDALIAAAGSGEPVPLARPPSSKPGRKASHSRRG